MFGSYEFGKSIAFDTVTIETYQDKRLFVYHRKSDTEVTKLLASVSPVVITPIEPVTQPKEITHYVMIELKNPLVLPPGKRVTYFVTFPLEVGVYVTVKGVVTPIDWFTLTNPKYTLYGTPDTGIICKWWESSVYSKPPDVNPYLEGIMKVHLYNTTNSWVELTRMVFDARSMKIFYRRFAGMNAVVRVFTGGARTSFREKPIGDGMEKAVELFTVRKIPLVKQEFVMEWGL
jgi:hypothetical protein